jgi:hypothetical protein
VSTLSLRELQQSFWRAVAGLPGAATPGAGLVALVGDVPPLAPAERLQIYAGMYLHRILDVLRDDFPRLTSLIGDQAFHELVRAYLADHPSTHPSLRHVGDALPTFLGDHAPLALPWAADLARLERARSDVFDAADAVVLGIDDLRLLAPADWPALRFRPVPALRTLTTAWPVHRLWADAGAAEAIAPALTTLRVWRSDRVVYHAVMDARETQALAAVTAGESFAAVCEAFDDAAAAGAQLLRWLEDGILARP